MGQAPPRLALNIANQGGAEVGYARFYPPAPSNDR